MKAVILAGGLGTRLSEETNILPKPMVPIGDVPIIMHIMKIFANAGVTEFIICAGFKQHVIKEYFLNYHRLHSDFRVDLSSGNIQIVSSNTPNWTVNVIDTGLNTMTGGRLKRVKKLIGESTFLMTYGDGVADIDIKKVIEFHNSHQSPATVTAVRAPGRFGHLQIEGHSVVKFDEKDEGERNRINGGFFVLDPEVLDLIDSEDTAWEAEPMRKLSEEGKLKAFMHDGFWQPMDTLKDKRYLDKLCHTNEAPWL